MNQAQYRSPSANVIENPNAAPVSCFGIRCDRRKSLTGLLQHFPRKYRANQGVWAYKEGIGWVEATVVAFTTIRESWYYQLKDANGSYLWGGQQDWIAENQLSSDTQGAGLRSN